MSRLSLIVPVYTGIEGVRRCVASIAQQTRVPDEVLLVDDCGGDGAFDAAMQEAHAQGLDVISIRHERNRGLSAARNSGLAAATGDVVGFLDSDDTIDPDFFAVLAGALCDPRVDIAVCRTGLVGGASGIAERSGCPTLLSGSDYARRMLVDDEKGYVCNKLFRRALLGADPFPEGQLFEDFAVTLRVVLAAEHVAVSHRDLYRYTIAEESISQRFGPHLADLFDQLEAVAICLTGRPGFEAEQVVHRVGGIALPVANMASRARHASADPQVRAVAAELLTRARSVVALADAGRLAASGHARLAVALTVLKLAPAAYTRILRFR